MKTSFQPSGFAAFACHKSSSDDDLLKVSLRETFELNMQFPKKGGFRESESNEKMRCEICGKTTVFGNKVAHDRMYVNGRTPRKVKPNLHTVHLDTPNGRKKMTVCTRCMRTLRKSFPAGNS